jgi:hypothetical protein
LPPGSVHQSREAQDLISTLRQRVGRAGERQLDVSQPCNASSQDQSAGIADAPKGRATEKYAKTA